MNHDELAFLNAITADPDDVVTRLVLADWLDEQGQAERANFIRLSVAAADPNRPDADRYEAKRQADAVLHRNRKAWERPLTALCQSIPNPPPGFSNPFLIYDRGIPIGVAAPIEVISAHGDKLLALVPTLRQLSLGDHTYDDSRVAQLAACPHLALFTELDCTGSLIRDAGVAALASSPHVTHLKSLDVRRRNLRREGLDALVESPSFPADMRISVDAIGRSLPGEPDELRFEDFRNLGRRLRSEQSGPGLTR